MAKSLLQHIGNAIDDVKNRKVVHRAMKFDISLVVDRFMDDHEISPDEARLLEQELKRFLTLCAVGNGRPYGMRGPVDALWHVFLLYTELYQEFCENVTGEKFGFLHHHPCNTETGSTYPITYDVTWYDYQEFYGEDPPGEVWPPPSGPRRSLEEIKKDLTEKQAEQQKIRDIGRRGSGGIAGSSVGEDGCGGCGCGG